MTTELELRHFWPDCEIICCYRCLWWDISFRIAMRFSPYDMIETKGLMS